MARFTAVSASLCLLTLAGPRVAQAQVVLETVTIGNPGNIPDDEVMLDDGSTGYGAVAYLYDIGKFEVTAGQYTAFLNAVAATDTYGLYNPNMDSDSFGCQITQNGAGGSYTYDLSGRPSGTEADWTNRPVNYVSWGDAARFSNWLHNGQPTGAQDLTTTEDGSYLLDGAMSDVELLAIAREPDATWVIPSEDEWYKAAYHKVDGLTGNYWDHPTKTDTVPTWDAPPGTDMTNGSANFNDGGFANESGYAIGGPYYRTEVGAYDTKPSDSPYGTFDQGGNLWEWNEAILFGSSRGLRGGSFASFGYVYLMLSARRRGLNNPASEGGDVGFRVAEVSEQAPVPAVSEWGMVATTLLVLTAGTLLVTKRRSPVPGAYPGPSR